MKACFTNSTLPTARSVIHANRAPYGPAMACSRPNLDVSVYVITSRAISAARIAEVVTAATKNGAKTIQLRDKSTERAYSISLGRTLREITTAQGATFLINDDVDLARLLNADGVHLGQDDGPVSHAREQLGEGKIVGVSTRTVAQAERAVADGADYIGVGCLFPTNSKTDVGNIIGVDKLAEIVKVVAGRVPVVAIGGIGVQNAAACRDAGANGVAVISAVMSSQVPEHVVSELSAIMRAPSPPAAE